MASYTYDDPSTSDRDAVRLLIGDTDENEWLLSDGEIAYFLTTHGTVNRAAAEAAQAIAARFARKMRQSVGALSADFGQKYRQYLELARTLQKRDELAPVGPYASGWVISDKEGVEEDTDREMIFGRKGVHDSPRTGTQDHRWTSREDYWGY